MVLKILYFFWFNPHFSNESYKTHLYIIFDQSSYLVQVMSTTTVTFIETLNILLSGCFLSIIHIPHCFFHKPLWSLKIILNVFLNAPQPMFIKLIASLKIN